MNPVRKASQEDLTKVENTLLADEKISLIFLLYDEVDAALQNATLCNVSTKATPLKDWVLQQQGHDWGKKMCEALAITGQFKLLRTVFGIDKQEANIRYLPESQSTSLCVSMLRKLLYILCEQLSEENCTDLIANMLQTSTANNSAPLDLEIYFLQWLKDGVISRNDMKSLSQALKVIERKDLLSVLENITPYMNINLENTSTLKQYYKIDPENMGTCYIINQKNFSQEGEDLTTRTGTDVDRDQLAETFSMFGYRVVVHQNLTQRKLLHVLHNAGKEVKETDSSIVICVLSHGVKDTVFCTDGRIVPIEKLKHPFTATRCPALINKPKLFFLQACQGTNLPKVVSSSTLNSEESNVASDSPVMCAQGPESAADLSDFLVFSSTVPGYAAFRNLLKGSYFIHAVTCELMKCSQQMDVSGILLAITRNACSNDIDLGSERVTTLPESRNTLSKDLKLKYRSSGVVEATKKRMQRALFNQLARQFLLTYCRAKINYLS